MSLLVDVDALSKLAHWQLLEVLPDLTGVPHSESATLTSVYFRARRASEVPDGRLFRIKEAAELAVTVTEQMSKLPVTSYNVLPELQGIVGIEAGEAVLLSVLCEDAEAVLLTGDKRAIRAVASSPKPIRISISGRILAVEQIVKAALEKYGIDWLRERICPQKYIDKAVSQVMGSRCDAPEDAVVDGLNSYINELSKLSSPSLLASLPVSDSKE